MKNNLRRIAITTLQIAITVAILYWVFHDTEKREKMGAALQHANGWWIFAGLLAYGSVEFLAAIRWQLLLRVQGIYLGWIRMGALLMIGVFFNLFLFGATGGDVAKIFYLLKETPGKRAQALLAVLMDRLIGLIALIFMSTALVSLRFEWLTGTTPGAMFSSLWSLGPVAWFAQLTDPAKLAIVLIVILGHALIGIIFSFFITGFGLVQRLPSRMPFHDKLVELSAAYNLYARAWKPSLAGFLISILAHGGYFLTFYLCAKAFSAVEKIPGLLDMFSIMPIVNTITALPISVSGVGVREKLFEELLGSLSGVSSAVAVLISSTGFLITVVWSLLGGLIYLMYRPSEHAKLAEIKREVKSVEETIVHPDEPLRP